MENKISILAVDDDDDILELVRFTLTREGFRVTTAISGEEALKIVGQEIPDMFLLDLMLPNLSGLDLTRRLKSSPLTSSVPVVMLTAKGEESDIVVGLELGADDYIVKPFSPRVLVARLRSVLRRHSESVSPDESSAIRRGNLVISPERFEVTVDDQPVTLTATEFRILRFLSLHPGWVYTRGQIVDAVRGEDYPVTDRAVDVHIVSLRRKLGDTGKLIETVRGVGYRFRN